MLGSSCVEEKPSRPLRHKDPDSTAHTGMALWLLLASLALVCPGGFLFASEVEPGPPVALSWSLHKISTNSSLLDVHVTWEPPPLSTVMPFLEYEVQIKEATEQQWKSYDLVTTSDLLVYGLKVGKEYVVRVRCRLRGNEKFGKFSEELVIPVFVSGFESKDPGGWPSITLCRSPQQETFTCHWTYGNFQNLSGSLKLQYIKPGIYWTDCPDNVSAGKNSCYFSKEHTSVWVRYLVRLVSENVTFDEYSFTVDDIVRPDPPIALNWTVLNVSATRLRMDIELTWDHPASADVKSGWISLEYEIQLKVVNETQWKAYDVVTTTYSPIYSLEIGKEYLIRIRCRQKGNENFGEFSDVLLITTIATIDPEFPWPLFLIIGLFAFLLVLAFILFCKKKRLKMLILPPVPVPKIKGIDPVLLQKGKLDEVSSILASHDSYKQQLCCDDPWVEFIELDLDDQEEKNEGADTDRLLSEEYPKTHSCLGVKDDDSGRASCCEPDIPETDLCNSDMSDETSNAGQSQNTKDNQADLLCLSEKSNSGNVPTNSQMPNTEKISTKPEDGKVCPLLGKETSGTATSQLRSVSSKPSMDFYALVSDITPAGRLLLSPGQRMKMENEECNEPTIQRPTNLNMDSSYVCDIAVTAFCAVNFPIEAAQSVQQNPNLDSYFTPESLTAATMSSRATEKASSYETPVADYTSVHIINSPQNLVLNTTAPPGKEFLQPCGYMSTDQVNNVMP
ncbi:growth hormone receptor isoform X1 [Bufo gargarizans]|uniref:growth hormone receptor isoform X1 n=2 Tax=Bufo gargarizans TaxID=30331 RepID=UPI001CF43DC7|nr:growth hormone receptor isoform X1 [Bufo gargarizans]XP_044132120.1 growth hormone receptor isoform X1 [Bufo gargarizans]